MAVGSLTAAGRLRERGSGCAVTKAVQTNYAFLARTTLVPTSGPVVLALDDPAKQLDMFCSPLHPK